MAGNSMWSHWTRTMPERYEMKFHVAYRYFCYMLIHQGEITKSCQMCKKRRHHSARTNYWKVSNIITSHHSALTNDWKVNNCWYTCHTHLRYTSTHPVMLLPQPNPVRVFPGLDNLNCCMKNIRSTARRLIRLLTANKDINNSYIDKHKDTYR